MIYNNKEFRPYDDNYYVSADGDIYSKRRNCLLKHNITCDGYHRVDIYKKHMMVHRLVYIVWIGPIPENQQINHKDDNKDNNRSDNLYAGTQLENIHDCKRNNHRVGRIKTLTILDMEINETIVFPSILDLIKYTGHPCANGSITKLKKHKWFKARYKIIKEKGVTTIEHYKSIRANYESWIENKASSTK